MDKKIIVIGALSLTLIIVILIIVYKAGKKKDPSQTEIDTDTYGTPLTEERKQFVISLSDSLYKDMNGLNTFGHEDGIYEALSLLSDSELVAVSNVFNAKYEQDSGETFLQWLRNETFSWDSFTNQDIMNVITSRLVGLGVS